MKTRNLLTVNGPRALLTSLLIAWLVLLLVEISSLDFYRHDSGYYLPYYEARFIQEGRWFNFLLFHFIKILPPYIHVFAYFFLSFSFFYLVSYKFSKDIYLSFYFATLCTCTPTLFSLILWPVSPFLSFFVMNFLFYIRNKVSYRELMFLSGVLTFGTYSNLHFLTPLIYLDRIRKEGWGFSARLTVYWVLSFVFGYLFSNILVYIVTFFKSDAATFIVLAPWRNPNPIVDIAGFYHNLIYVLTVIKSNVLDSSLLYTVVAFITSLFLFKSCREEKIILWILMIFLSFYLSNLYHGITISFRSLVTAFVSLNVLFILVGRKYGPAIMLFLSFVLMFDNQYKINWFEARTKEVSARFESIEKEMLATQGVVFVYLNKKSRDKYYLTEEGIPYDFLNFNNVRYRQIRPLFLERGFEEVEFVYTNTPYTGAVRGEVIEGQLHVYLE